MERCWWCLKHPDPNPGGPPLARPETGGSSPAGAAALVFDDRDYGINKQNAEAITNFFQRSSWGLSLDSIVKTPFFAISQSQNIGLQLADFVTTVVGLRFSSHPQGARYFHQLKPCLYSYDNQGHRVSSLKVLRGQPTAP